MLLVSQTSPRRGHYTLFPSSLPTKKHFSERARFFNTHLSGTPLRLGTEYPEEKSAFCQK
jgi:hypothetical protein